MKFVVSGAELVRRRMWVVWRQNASANLLVIVIINRGNALVAALRFPSPVMVTYTLRERDPLRKQTLLPVVTNNVTILRDATPCYPKLSSSSSKHV